MIMIILLLIYIVGLPVILISSVYTFTNDYRLEHEYPVFEIVVFLILSCMPIFYWYMIIESLFDAL